MSDPNDFQEAPIIEIELSHGEKFSPKSIHELHDWVHAEVTAWGFLRAQSFDTTGNLLPLSKTLASLIGLRDSLQRSITQRQDRPRIEDLSTFQQLFVEQKLPHSSTAIAGAIRDFHEQFGARAAEIYAATIIEPPNSRSRNKASIADWHAFTLGIIDRYNILHTSHDGPLKNRMDIVDRLSTDLKQHYAESSDRFNHLETRYEESIQLSQSALESHAKNHQALHEKHQDGMETIRKTFREEIALREPNKYWQGKCSRHQMYATIWGIATAILLAIAMLGLAHFAPDYFSKMDSLPSIESGKPYPAVVAHDTWRIGVFALMAIFGFWAVRLVVRMFLSHLHLHADASERMVMLQTYLALMEGNKLEDKDDRKLILQALFRPSTDGLVKDESAPPSIGEWLTRSGK